MTGLANKRVLVTGAGGFIGSHLVERLVATGANTCAMVHYRSNGTCGWMDHSSARDSIEIVAGDVRDPDSVARAMRGIEIVFHLAALIGIPYSYDAPRSYVDTNLIGTLNVLQAARDVDIERVVHTSTSEVYGTAQYVPIDEKHPFQGQSPYSASKIAADKMAEAFHLSFQLPVVTVRPFNTFGPRQSARAVIPTIIAQCLRGNVVRIGSQKPTRDFNFVENTVDGFIKAAASSDALGQTINLGSGSEISIGELAQTIAELVGKDINIEQEQIRVRPVDSELDRLLADNVLASELLGWIPKVSLTKGLERTINWIGEHQSEYRPDEYAV